MTAPAQNLNEAKARLSLEPLTDTATDYVDLSAARGSKCLAKLAALDAFAMRAGKRHRK